MWICNPEYSLTKPVIIQRCLNLSEIASLNRQIRIPKPRMPICLKFDSISVPSKIYLSADSILVFDRESAEIDLITAANRGNCMRYPDEIYDPCACTIRVSFTGSDNEFSRLEFNQSAVAQLSHGPNWAYQLCELDCSDSRIVINNSINFLRESQNASPSSIPKKFFITDKYAADTNILNKLQENGCRVYNFAELIMHEIGHFFSFDHYDNSSCGNPSCYTQIMNSHLQEASGVSRPLTDFDRCRFAVLYARTVDIDDEWYYEDLSAEVYPVPTSNSISITFNSYNNCQQGKVEIFNSIGQYISTHISEKFYYAGEHTEIIDISDFDTGSYSLLLHLCDRTIAKHFIVIK